MDNPSSYPPPVEPAVAAPFNPAYPPGPTDDRQKQNPPPPGYHGNYGNYGVPPPTYSASSPYPPTTMGVTQPQQPQYGMMPPGAAPGGSAPMYPGGAVGGAQQPPMHGHPSAVHTHAGYSANNQQTRVVVVQQPGVFGPRGGAVGGYYPDNTGAIIFACMVAWCCCCVLGIIAFVYAITSRDRKSPQEAMRNLMMSRYFSIAGLITGISFYVIITAVRIALASSSD